MTGAAKQHILVVDDEEQVCELLRNLFEREGFQVSVASSGSGMLAALDKSHVNLITLDLNLRGEDGLSLARQVRASRNVPIIMITAKTSDIDRVVGLELGADDYIVKPFNLREVLARVRAVLRRYAPSDNTQSAAVAAAHERYRLDSMIFDLQSRVLMKADGEKIALTTAEFDLLALLVRRPHRVLSRDMIMDLLKGHEWSPVDRSIDTLVGRLRKKIEADVDAPKLIKTVRGVGYVLAADIMKI
jgi:DNA-binding response OmpR family regulator